MKDYNEISDRDIRDLLRKRLLEQTDLTLLESQAKYVFAAESLIIPSAEKEAKLIKKLTKTKNSKKYFKWILLIFSITILTILFYNSTIHSPVTEVVEPEIKVTTTNPIPTESSALSGEEPLKTQPKKKIIESYIAVTSDFNKGQFIETILKENADCIHPILLKDTIVFSPHSPKGPGNELEIINNEPDDEQYFENEHNTVWYKFWAKEDCFLTFDIIPVNKNDDYDFMLFRDNGGDFRAKILTKRLRPIRTCISRNDKSIESKTGLSMNEPIKLFVHSGVGPSYVKYVEVKKNEAYYLLVDNVYENGNGHSIHFHYQCTPRNELYVGKSINLDKVSFVSDDYKFRSGSDKGLDSLYLFLKNNDLIKVEIQGHVNTGNGASPYQYGPDKLSTLRAQAIYNYLVNKGIPENRLSYVGYGDRKKKIKVPTCIKEYLINIRADILILSLDYKKDLEWIKNHENQENAPH